MAAGAGWWLRSEIRARPAARLAINQQIKKLLRLLPRPTMVGWYILVLGTDWSSHHRIWLLLPTKIFRPIVIHSHPPILLLFLFTDRALLQQTFPPTEQNYGALTTKPQSNKPIPSLVSLAPVPTNPRFLHYIKMLKAVNLNSIIPFKIFLIVNKEIRRRYSPFELCFLKFQRIRDYLITSSYRFCFFFNRYFSSIRSGKFKGYYIAIFFFFTSFTTKASFNNLQNL